MPAHAPDCDCDTYGCELRRKGFTLSSAATPTRTQRRPFRPGPRFNSWEKGVKGEHRPDGSFMPYLNGDGQKIHVKEFSENRKEYEAIRARQIQGTSKKE